MKHYVAIGESVRVGADMMIQAKAKRLSKKKLQKEFERWNKIFKSYNPDYDSNRFAKHIGLEGY